MNVGEDPSAGSDDALSKSRAIQVAAEAEVAGAIKKTKNFGTAVFDALRFVLFFLFVLTGILRFWLLGFTLVLHLVRVAIQVLTIPLRTASGASLPRLARRNRPARIGSIGITLHYELVKPLAHLWVESIDTIRCFWHYTIARKTLVIVLTFFLIIVPGSYLVPRPHTVQILDNNVLNNQVTPLSGSSVGYLIHAIDTDDPTHTREYVNENAWWLGKVNPQGLKARLVPGRFYRMWVVGLRWWFAPTLYPNIISVTETDAEGNVLAHPSTFIPTTTTGE
jgi:hypothetical protein